MLIPSALNLMIKHRHLFPREGDVVDLGDQLLYSREHAANALPAIREQLTGSSLSDYECVSAIYTHLGLTKRTCIDYSDNADIRINLNYTALSVPGIESRFDVVTNQGFSEHVFNQYATFECIHHICKPGGHILHVLPCQGWADGGGWGHGFFQYQPNFFRHLAAANNYKIIDFQISTFSPSDKIYDFTPEVYPAISNPHLISEKKRNQLYLDQGQFVSLLVLLQKSSIHEVFRPPHE
jgi:SAM-dependent methyltransferase